MRISDWSSDVCSSDLGSLLYVRSVIVTVVYTCSASAVAAAIQEPFALIALSAWRRPMAKKSTRGSFSSTGSVSRQGYVLGRHKRRSHYRTEVSQLLRSRRQIRRLALESGKTSWRARVCHVWESRV